ncbi:MAG: polymerase [Bacteroidetes bacterium]|nr:polymerase [Bacteroidota bacterium]
MQPFAFFTFLTQNRLKMEQQTVNTGIHSSVIAAAKNADNNAFKELYNLYSKAMYNISYRIVNNKDEAEDVLQEAFLKAFQNIQKFENAMAFGGWLKKVVINRSIDLVRKRKINFVAIDDKTQGIEEEEENAEYEVETLRSCILELPDNYRIVLTLFLFENQSHKEIATLLNISEGTSKSHFHRAKKKLLTLLKEKKHEY